MNPQGSEIVFDIEIVNISAFEQTVFLVRTINNLPQDWAGHHLFVLVNCVLPSIDSVATTPPKS